MVVCIVLAVACLVACRWHCCAVDMAVSPQRRAGWVLRGGVWPARARSPGLAAGLAAGRRADGRASGAQGMMPNLVKVAPAAGISWFVFEEVKRLMGMSPRV